MKNLFAAIIMAVIIFFLSSCGEGVATSDAVSASSQLPVESKIEEIISSQPTETTEEEKMAMISSQDYNVLAETGINAVRFVRPEEFSDAEQGEKVSIKIDEFGCRLGFIKNRKAKGSSLIGYELTEVYFGNLLKMSGKIEVFSSENKNALLLKQGDDYIACFGKNRSFITKTDEFDSLFCSENSIHYEKKHGNIIEIGNIEDKNIGYELVKTMEINTDNYTVSISDTFDEGDNGQFQYDVSSYCWNFQEVLCAYFKKENIDIDNAEIRLSIESAKLEFVFKGEETLPDEFYFNGKLVCKPSEIYLSGENERNIIITRMDDRMKIFYYNLEEVFYSDSRTWLCFGDEIVELEDSLIEFTSNLKYLGFDADGAFVYRRIADGSGRDYLYYRMDGFYDFETFEEFLEEFQKTHGDEAPDVDEPYYEYGEIVLKDGKATYAPTHTHSIRELFEIELEERERQKR